jgi:hypothetical protein
MCLCFNANFQHQHLGRLHSYVHEWNISFMSTYSQLGEYNKRWMSHYSQLVLQQHPALIPRVWPLIIGVLVVFSQNVYTPCCINIGARKQSVAGKTGQDIK